RDRLGAVLDGLAAALPTLKVTVDPVENRGFEYHSGISFSFFARGATLGELARAGDRLYPLHRHDPAHPARGGGPAPAAAAVRRRPGGCRGAARGGLGDRRRAGAGGGLARGGAAARLRSRPGGRPAGPGGRRRWVTSPWSAPNGATKARARSSTGCRNAPRSSCASRAATTPATPWSSAMSNTV